MQNIYIFDRKTPDGSYIFLYSANNYEKPSSLFVQNKLMLWHHCGCYNILDHATYITCFNWDGCISI